MVDPNATQSLGPDAPEQIGPYAIIGLLGTGGMGEVWLGQQLEPVPRRAAVKIVAHGAGKDVLHRFEEERRLLASLEHPGIAKLFEVGATEDGRPWFAMEVVHGRPIDEYCEGLGLQKRLALFRRVCLAVQHAHLRGIVHRDLKPTNILVEDVDGEALPKIIDFGIAKALDRRHGSSPLKTVVGGFLGTPAYASPEQAGGDPEKIDTRADVYSLGAILYQLVSDVPPFDPADLAKMTTFELQRTIAEVVPQPPSAVARNGFELGALDNVVLRALEKDPELRFADAAALTAAIDAHLETRILESDGARHENRSAAKSSRAWVGTLALFCAIALLGVTLWIASKNFESPSDRDPRESSSEAVSGDRSTNATVGAGSGAVARELSRIDLVPFTVTRSADELELIWPRRDGLRPTRVLAAERGRLSRDVTTFADLESCLADGSAIALDVRLEERQSDGVLRLVPPVGVEGADVFAAEFACADGLSRKSAVVRSLARTSTPWFPRWESLGPSLEIPEVEALGARPLLMHCDTLGWTDLVLVDGTKTEASKVLVYDAKQPGVFEFYRRSKAALFDERPFAASAHYHDTDAAPDLFLATERGLYVFAGIHANALGLREGRVFSHTYRPENQDPPCAPIAFATGDYNGDGIVDIATIEAIPGGYGLVMRVGSRKPGTIEFNWQWEDRKSKVQLPMSSDDRASIALRDLDADGRDDLLIAIDRTSGDDTILVKPGDATYQLQGGMPTFVRDGVVDFSKPAWALVDVNGDGYVDLLDIDASREGSSERLRVRLGGPASFGSGRPFDDVELDHVVHVEAADVDADGIDDLVIGHRDESGATHVSVLIGDRGDERRAWFAKTRVDIGTFEDFVDVRTGRFDADPILDLVVVQRAPSPARGLRVTSFEARARTPGDVSFDFVGERRSASLAEECEASSSGGNPGSSLHVVARGTSELVAMESANRRKPCHFVTLHAETTKETSANFRSRMNVARIVDPFGYDVVRFDANGNLVVDALLRGYRRIGDKPKALLSVDPIEEFWPICLIPRVSLQSVPFQSRDWILTRSSGDFATYAWQNGAWQTGPAFEVSDIPDAVVIADLDANGLDDVLAFRKLRTHSTELDVRLCVLDVAARGKFSFLRMNEVEATGQAGLRYAIPGSVSSIVVTPIGGRAGYDDAYSRGLVVGREDGSMAGLYAKYPPVMPGYALQSAGEGEFEPVFPGKPLVLGAADFDGDGLEDLIVAARDGSQLQVRFQDPDTKVPTGSPCGTGVFSRIRTLTTPWGGMKGWRVVKLLALRLDEDPLPDLVVLAEHDGGEASILEWLTKPR
ncbi:MAG: protein kinase [Planctomycetes bacterium]|nr:protein kinase [Planctomycetota bacterium]